MMEKAWKNFKPGAWMDEINVRDFIQKNYTPYEGGSEFLEKATPRCAVCGIEKYELHQLGNCHICTVCAKRVAVMTEGVWT